MTTATVDTAKKAAHRPRRRRGSTQAPLPGAERPDMALVKNQDAVLAAAAREVNRHLGRVAAESIEIGRVLLRVKDQVGTHRPDVDGDCV